MLVAEQVVMVALAPQALFATLLKEEEVGVDMEDGLVMAKPLKVAKVVLVHCYHTEVPMDGTQTFPVMEVAGGAVEYIQQVEEGEATVMQAGEEGEVDGLH